MQMAHLLPPFVIMMRGCVLDDVATVEIGDPRLVEDTINSKLIYFVKGDGSSGVALQGDRGYSGARGLKGDSGDKGLVGSQDPTGKRGVEGPAGPPGKIGKMGPVGSKGGIGACGKKGAKGDIGSVGQQGPIGPQGSTGPRCVQCAKRLSGVAGIQGPLGVQGPVGSTGEQGGRGLVEDEGDRGERGVKGEKGIQGDNSNVLSVLADHLSIQLVTPYGEKMCFVKYHISGPVDYRRIVGMLCNVSTYHEPMWHCDAKFINGQGHEKANVQKAAGHGHF